MAAILDEAREGNLVPLADAHELAQPLRERFHFAIRERGEADELRIREQVDATRRVEIRNRGHHALSRRAQGRAHLRLRPRERLDAPLLTLLAVVVERHLVAFAHDDIGEREADGGSKPVVVAHEIGRRDVALGCLDCVVDDVGAEDLVRHDLAPPRARQRREAPEASVQERKRRDGVVAARHRQDAAARAGLEGPFLNDEDARLVREPPTHAALKDERVVLDVISLERPRPPHECRRHDARAGTALRTDAREEGADRGHGSTGGKEAPSIDRRCGAAPCGLSAPPTGGHTTGRRDRRSRTARRGCS